MAYTIDPADRLGAFTPACQANHLPPYVQHIDEIKKKGVDIVAVIASNDCWVMCAWGKVNKISNQGNKSDIVRQSCLHHQY